MIYTRFLVNAFTSAGTLRCHFSRFYTGNTVLTLLE